MYSMEKSRGARYVLYAKKENLRSKSDCSFKEAATYSRSILVNPIILVFSLLVMGAFLVSPLIATLTKGGF